MDTRSDESIDPTNKTRLSMTSANRRLRKSMAGVSKQVSIALDDSRPSILKPSPSKMAIRRKTQSGLGGPKVTITDARKESLRSTGSSTGSRSRRNTVLLDPSMPSTMNIHYINPELEYSLDLIANKSQRNNDWASQTSTRPLTLEIRPRKQPMSTKSFQNALDGIDDVRVREVPTVRRHSKETTFTGHKFQEFQPEHDEVSSYKSSNHKKHRHHPHENSEHNLLNSEGPTTINLDEPIVNVDNLPIVNPEGDSLNPEGDSLNPEGDSLNPEGDSLNPEGDSLNPEGDSLKPEGDSLNVERDSLNTERYSLNPERDLLNREHAVDSEQALKSLMPQENHISNAKEEKKKRKSKNHKRRTKGEGSVDGSNSDPGNSYSNTSNSEHGSGSDKSGEHISMTKVQFYNEVDGKFYDIVSFPPTPKEGNKTLAEGQGQAQHQSLSTLKNNDEVRNEKDGLISTNGTSGKAAGESNDILELVAPPDNQDLFSSSKVSNRMTSKDKIASSNDMEGVKEEAGINDAGQEAGGTTSDLQKEVIIIIDDSDITMGGQNAEEQGGTDGPRRDESTKNAMAGSSSDKVPMTKYYERSILAGDSSEAADIVMDGLKLGLSDDKDNLNKAAKTTSDPGATKNAENLEQKPKMISDTAFGSTQVDMTRSDILRSSGFNDSNKYTNKSTELQEANQSLAQQKEFQPLKSQYESTGQPMVKVSTGNQPVIVHCTTDTGGNERNSYVCDLPPISPSNETCEASTIDLSFRVRVTNRCRCRHRNCSAQNKQDIPEEQKSKECIFTLMEPTNAGAPGSASTVTENSSAHPRNKTEDAGTLGANNLSALDPNILMKAILNPELENQLQGPARREAIEQYITPLTKFLEQNLPSLNIQFFPKNDNRKKSTKAIKASVACASLTADNILEMVSEEYLRYSHPPGAEDPVLVKLGKFFSANNLPIILTQQLLDLNYQDPNGITEGTDY